MGRELLEMLPVLSPKKSPSMRLKMMFHLTRVVNWVGATKVTTQRNSFPSCLLVKSPSKTISWSAVQYPNISSFFSHTFTSFQTFFQSEFSSSYLSFWWNFLDDFLIYRYLLSVNLCVIPFVSFHHAFFVCAKKSWISLKKTRRGFSFRFCVELSLGGCDLRARRRATYQKREK